MKQAVERKLEADRKQVVVIMYVDTRWRGNGWYDALNYKRYCLKQIKRNIYQNQIFHYTRWVTPKRVTSSRGPSPRHFAQATQLLLKKCCSGGEPLATLCPIRPARDLKLGPPAPETNALPLDRLAKTIELKHNDLGSTSTRVTLLHPWIKRFRAVISGSWLRTSNIFTLEEAN